MRFKGRFLRVRDAHATSGKYDRVAAESQRVELAVLCVNTRPRGTQFPVRANGAVPAKREDG